jgi:HSP20 family molecular chaperone IbpA
MTTSPYSPFLFEGIIFRKASGGRFPTAERRTEFQSVRESTFVATQKDNIHHMAIALPGLRQGELNVNLNNNRLTITGTRNYISKDRTRRKRYKFQQTFFVDDSVDKDKLTADLKNQVLTLSVPEFNYHLMNPVTDESEIEKVDSVDSEESLPVVDSKRSLPQAQCMYSAAEVGR